jgi:indoleamine 2,3-dioxygenase
MPSQVATGGSPIVTWLPNQLSTVLEMIVSIGSVVDTSRLTHDNRDLYDLVTLRAKAQARALQREVAELRKKFPGQ